MVLWDINAQALKDVHTEFKAKNYDVTTYVCDVSDRPTIYSVAAKVTQEVGKVGIQKEVERTREDRGGGTEVVV